MSAALLVVLVVSQEPAEAERRAVQRLTKSLTNSVETELLLVRRLTSLPDGQADAILESLTPRIALVAEGFVQRVPAGPNTPEILPKELSSDIASQIGAAVGERAKVTYQLDVVKRRQLYMKAVLGVTVVMIDHRVNLTVDQHKDVLLMLTQEWKNARFCERARLSDDLRPMRRDDENDVLPVGFPEASLLKLLSPAQQDAWQFHARRWRENPELFATIGKPVTPTNVFVQMLQHHAEILVEQLKLSKKQRSRLRLLAKKAGQQAHRLQLEARALEENVPKEPTRGELDIWEATYTQAPELSRCLTDWQQLVLQVLSEQQQRAITNRRATRNQHTHSAWAANVTHILGRAYGWTGSESQQMFQKFLQAPIATKGILTASKRMAFCAQIPKDNISEILDGPRLDNMRSWQAFLGRFHKNSKRQVELPNR